MFDVGRSQLKFLTSTAPGVVPLPDHTGCNFGKVGRTVSVSREQVEGERCGNSEQSTSLHPVSLASLLRLGRDASPYLRIPPQQFKFQVSVMLLGCALALSAHAYDRVTIYPGDVGAKIDHFFYDFKSPSAPWKFTQKGWAKTLLEEYGFTGIRTSIYGTGGKPAHPAPGVVLEQYYKGETRGLKLAKQIKPDTIIFASKKLANKESFPAWTKDDDGVIPEKYAILIIDYMEYMKREGLEVDVLGIDNERRFNEGNIMPARHRAIVEALRRLTRERGLKMPLIIGHEDFEMGRNKWMERFMEEGGDTMDIFGGHYYPQWRILDRLKSDLAYAGGRQKWHTELHWDSKPADDPLLLATKAYLALWDCTDNGMSGFSWWDLNPKRKIRDHLMHAVTVPLVNARPVKVIDPDGSGTVDVNELHTRAFLNHGLLTIFAVNYNASKQWRDLRFRLASGRIVGKVEGRQWSDDYPDEGRVGMVTPYGANSFSIRLAPRTITRLQCNVTP